MADYTTVFGSLDRYEKGRLEIIDDDPRHYAFSNVFEGAAQAQPYEKIAVAKNLEYVVEVLRAEGRSDWFACAHPRSVLARDAHGAVRVPGSPAGRKMGWMKLSRGHQALLPADAAYQFVAAQPGVVLLQTLHGALTVEKWAQVCQT